MRKRRHDYNHVARCSSFCDAMAISSWACFISAQINAPFANPRVSSFLRSYCRALERILNQLCGQNCSLATRFLGFLAKLKSLVEINVRREKLVEYKSRLLSPLRPSRSILRRRPHRSVDSNARRRRFRGLSLGAEGTVENRAIGTPRSNYPICLRWSPMPDSVHVREVPYLEFPRLRSQRCWISRVLSLSKTNLLRTCILDRINERVLTSMCEERVTIFRFFEGGRSLREWCRQFYRPIVARDQDLSLSDQETGFISYSKRWIILHE